MSSAAARLRDVLEAHKTAETAVVLARDAAAKELEELTQLLGGGPVAGGPVATPQTGPVCAAATAATAAAVHTSPWAPLAALHPGIAAAASKTTPAQVVVTPPIAAQSVVAVAATQVKTPKANHRVSIDKLVEMLRSRIVQVHITNTALNVEFNRGAINVGETLRRFGFKLGVQRFQPHPTYAHVCFTTMTDAIRAKLTKVHLFGSSAPTDEALQAVAEFIFVECCQWNLKGSKKLEQFNLPDGYAKAMGVVNHSFNTVPTTVESLDEMFNTLNTVSTIDTYTTPVRRDSRGGGGASAAPNQRAYTGKRSVKQNLAEETGPSFKPTGKLADLIEKHCKVVPGANNTLESMRLKNAMQTHGLARYDDGLVAANPGSQLTSVEIEKILCDVFKLKTAAQIADSKCTSAAESYKKQQKEAHAAQNAGIGNMITGAAGSGDDTDNENSDDDEPESENSKPVTGDDEPKPVTGADVRLVIGDDEHCHNISNTEVQEKENDDDEAAKSEEENEEVEEDDGTYRTLPKSIILQVDSTNEKTAIYESVGSQLDVLIDVDDNTFSYQDGRFIDDDAGMAVCKALAVAVCKSVMKLF